MLRKKYLASYIFLSMMFLQGVSAQTESLKRSNSETQPFTDLTLEITLPEQSVLSLQPIPIIIRESNKTNQNVLGYKGLSLDVTPILLYVKKNGTGERVSISPQSAVAGNTFFTNAAIAPGTSFETKGIIKIGLDRYFPETGVYEIQAALRNDGKSKKLHC